MIKFSMPYRTHKPFIKVNGQRLYSPGAAPQQLPFCDKCDELAVTSVSLFTELACNKWWKWLSYPQFSEKKEAFMGCKEHPVEAEILFLNGTYESYTGRLPENRWQHWKWHIFWAAVFAVAVAIIPELLIRLFH
jgi:hypothetical protein